MSESERVVELLNAASVVSETSDKLEALKIVQELLVHKEPTLLDNFLDEVMGFQKDRAQDVRKFVVGFIEEACKRDPEMLPKVIANLQLLMGDSALAVQKRVIQAMTHLYRVALVWISKAKALTEDMEAVWSVVGKIKDIVTHLLDAANDGIRTHTVKFMEMLVILQTHRETEGMAAVAGAKQSDFCLNDVPLTLKIARRRKLEDEAGVVFEELVKYHESSHISSANLMTTMGALVNMARMRPQQFMAKVVTSIEMVHANLPPTLAKSQVSSVRKHLKNQLLAILRHPVAAENYFSNITTLLTDLGASREEVTKAMPRFDEMKKKMRRAQQEKKEKESAAAAAAVAAAAAKRSKDADDSDDDDDDDDDEDDDDDDEDEGKQKMHDSAVDITEKFVLERMTPALATELVMKSMFRLPAEIPAHFNSTYTPIAAAGTDGQVKHVSRLLAAQLTSNHLGPGIEQVRKDRKRNIGRAMLDDEEDEGSAVTATKISVIGGVAPGSREAKKSKVHTLQPAGMGRTRARAVRLADMTKPLLIDERKAMVAAAIRRIFKAERASNIAAVPKVRFKVLTSLAAMYSSDMKTVFLEYIFEDLLSRSDLALSWLYEEYCYYQGFNRTSSMLQRRNDDAEYDSIMLALIKGVINKTEGKDREQLLRRFYLEPPIITEEAIKLLKKFILIEGTAITVVNLMKDLVMCRPTKKLHFLNFLLEFCSHEIREVRETANKTVLQLHENGDFNEIIEDFSVMYLRFLLSPTPPPLLFGEERGRMIMSATWTEDLTKVCIHLYLSLLPQNLKMFPHLADVYKAAGADVKRTILRVLDISVRNIDMDNAELLDIVESCPKGAETLVTRVIHILTDMKRPTPALVDKVRDLYENRFSDVRFLIPVLNGLSKQEVITALPKLIKLNPVVVKEVFNRLLNPTNAGPLSPVDLLIALHNMDPDKSDMKTVIRATSLCFQDRQTFTQDALVNVLQQLMEQATVPLLLMRTVIQAVTTYPRLIGFVMNNILQRLIVKQVWKQPKVWDGFIKCCERTVPQSHAVMLQLPPAQLSTLLEASPALREPLLQHVQNFTESQRAHVGKAVVEVLYEKDVDRVLRSRSLGDVGDADAEDAIASADPAPPGGGDL